MTEDVLCYGCIEFIERKKAFNYSLQVDRYGSRKILYCCGRAECRRLCSAAFESMEKQRKVEENLQHGRGYYD